MTGEWYEQPARSDPDLGVCTGCALQPTCPQAGPDYRWCAVTGGSPPPAPPTAAPGAPDPVEGPAPYDPSTDSTAASLGLVESVAGLVDRLHPEPAKGEPDWSRLQIAKNLYGLGVAVFLPGPSGRPLAFGAADLVAQGPGTALFAPLGGALMATVVVWAGSHVPGPAGAILGGIRAVAVRAVNGVLALFRSRWSWVVARPLAWAAVAGVLIVTGRPIVRILTGA